MCIEEDEVPHIHIPGSLIFHVYLLIDYGMLHTFVIIRHNTQCFRGASKKMRYLKSAFQVLWVPNGMLHMKQSALHLW